MQKHTHTKSAQATDRPKGVDINLINRLAEAGLRPTRQRLALAELMFGNGHRHMTAEQLFDDAREANQRVSLATVYNTLNQFAEAGLLNAVAADQGRTYFDTNVSDHHHFFMEDTGQLIDVPGDEVKVTGRPAAPEGYEIDQIQVVVRVRRKKQ
ncbi:MAG TPA: transcriptional repressor [Rhodospirillaceae bacterium]|nr:transcriptional repressor [Alphaproteobacteria bacterium]OUT41016.1 MAG: transcriptional repressor [Micavibrio sp. TMED2]HCI48217.1 transcriptional repressor [Rhodospirillaceae bacterium]MAS47489.1 transcriptional repressor [Alphaproteobacteria bacterium]MAX96639.1 transcriptional repressor [Alphaproteobacteria bacterium]|tara:strand:+ start:8011 stop:8472 length:462 start_codon:yes stop_codon:yes gene_type:complete